MHEGILITKVNNVTILIGIAPNGFTMFISKVYGGRASEIHQSEFRFNKILLKNQVMSGCFTSDSELRARHAILSTSHHSPREKQLSEF